MELSEVISLQNLVDDSIAVDRSVETLRRGKLVVFPTETVYGLAALASNEEAVQRLCVQKGRKTGHALSIAISGLGALSRYIPNVGPLARRFARRYWPGPLTLVLYAEDPASELKRFPRLSLDAIMPEKFVGFRVPKNDFLLRVLQKLDEPIVLTSANLSGKTPAKSASEARDALGNRPDLIIDDGEAEIGEPSTVLMIDGTNLRILRQGSLSEEVVKQTSFKNILFVERKNDLLGLTGETVCKKLIAGRLKTSIEELDNIGYRVSAVGLDELCDPEINSRTGNVSCNFSASSESGRLRPNCQKSVIQADMILTTDVAIQDTLLDRFPESRGRVSVIHVNDDKGFVPFDSVPESYSKYMKQMEEQLKHRLEEILE